MAPNIHSTLTRFLRSCELFSRNLRLSRHVRSYRTISSARAAVHYPPELEKELDLFLPSALHRYHRELVDLTQQFGIELAAPVSVFLMRSVREIRRFFRMDASGLALTTHNAIVLEAGANDPETIRHEFAHLFSAVWNPTAPMVLSEGLSVWLQGTDGGEAVERAGKEAMYDTSLTLNRLLTEETLFLKGGPRRNECYMLAGSFTGFLIRHHGWDPYRAFYSIASADNFLESFRDCFDIGLDPAEELWRLEAIPRGS